MEKIIQDIEKLKKELWAMGDTLNIEALQAQLNEFQNEIQQDVSTHVATLSSNLTQLQDSVQNEVNNQIEGLTTFKQTVDSQVENKLNDLTEDIAAFKNEVGTDLQTDFSNLSSSVNNQFTNMQSDVQLSLNTQTQNINTFKTEVQSSIDSQNQEIDSFQEEVTRQLEEIASAGSSGAMTDGSNIVADKWVAKLLTGQVGYGDKIIAKSMLANGYIKFASGLLIQWGNDFDNIDKADYQAGAVTFATPFSSSNSYAVSIAPRRASAINYRDTTFAIRNLSTSGFGYMWYGQSYANDRWQLQWIAIGY